MSKNYFNLFSCCIPVKGAKRAVICDLQRDQVYSVPASLYEILIHFVMKGKSMITIKSFWNNENDNVIDDYFDYLEKFECGFFSEECQNLPQIDTNSFFEPKPITNAIVDISAASHHDLRKIINELSELKCEALELRFYKTIDIIECERTLEIMSTSTLRCVEVLLSFHESFSIENIIELRAKYARLRKITLYNSAINKILDHDALHVIYTKLDIHNEQFCGVVSPWYFISKTENFVEAKNFNSCLNRKIAIDKCGNIKNCPSMNVSYGNAQDTSLIDVVKLPNFTKVWQISKDQISVCRDCEYRYVCQDCRVYTVDNDLFSKPSKCKYDPYL
jgi:SPASM domain peptide maturase of grasp-with-spasm system